MIAVPLLRRHFDDRIERCLADDRDQQVDSAQCLFGASEDGRCLLVVKHVGRKRDGRLTEQIDLGCNLGGPPGVDVGDRDATAGLSQQSRRAQAQALAAADNERRLAFEFE